MDTLKYFENDNKKIIENLDKFKMIMFDFDETLYTGGDWHDYYNKIVNYLEEYGYTDKGEGFLEMLRNEYPDVHNVGYRVCYYLKKFGKNVNFLYDRFNEDIYDITAGNIKLMDYSLLEKLSKKLPIYLVTDNTENYIERYSKMFGIDLGLFRKVYYNKHEGEDFTKSFYMQKCMEDAGILANETLMVGDDPYTDITAAKNIGISAYLVSDISETENLIKNILKLKKNNK